MLATEPASRARVNVSGCLLIAGFQVSINCRIWVSTEALNRATCRTVFNPVVSQPIVLVEPVACGRRGHPRSGEEKNLFTPQALCRFLSRNSAASERPPWWGPRKTEAAGRPRAKTSR